MSENTILDPRKPVPWQGITAAFEPSRWVFDEATHRFRLEILTEQVSRGIAALIVYGSFLPWVLFLGPDARTGFYETALQSLSLLFIGITLYAFATRGYRNRIEIDLERDRLAICRLNGFGNSRIAHVFPLRWIEEVRIKPQGDASAALQFVLTGRSRPFTALRGDTEETRDLSERLCYHLGRACPDRARPPEYPNGLPAVVPA